ncbi:MAG: FCD domain-containing protein [Candidatus Competibacteraceae bacterium]|nr:FCD domain-containing protein [Candidatus Competibacteraceae bacterium]
MRLAMENSTETVGARLAANLAGMELAIERRDVVAYRTLDGEFHQLIVDCCDNLFLSEAYAGIAFRVQALRNRLSVDSELNRKSLTEHADLVMTIRSGDSAAAEACLRAHIRGTRAHYLAALAG